MALEAGTRRRKKRERRWEAAAMEADPNSEGCVPRRLASVGFGRARPRRRGGRARLLRAAL